MVLTFQYYCSNIFVQLGTIERRELQTRGKIIKLIFSVRRDLVPGIRQAEPLQAVGGNEEVVWIEKLVWIQEAAKIGKHRRCRLSER